MEIKEAIKIIKGLIASVELAYKSSPLTDKEARPAIDALNLAISALEKQEQAENEWCPDCAEYDKENHCCHRFTKVIRQTVEECKREWANEGWIPVTERLPEEYGEYRITWKTSCSKKRLIADAEYEPENEYDAVNREFIGKWLLEDNMYYPDVEVIAWKPIEKPYKAEEEA